MCTHTHPHLIIIILAEKGKVRDQLWPNPRMHCTSVSATSISFFPLAGETHWGFPRRHHYFSLCPVSCGVSNTEEILMSYWGKKQWQYFLCWLSPILSCEGLVVHHSARGHRSCKVIYFKHFTPFSVSFSRTMFDMKRDAPVISSLVPLEWTKRPTFQPLLMTLHLRSFDNAVS